MRQFFRAVAEALMIGYAFPAIVLIKQLEKDTPDDIKEAWLVVFGALCWSGLAFIFFSLVVALMRLL